MRKTAVCIFMVKAILLSGAISFAQGTRPHGSLVIEANAKQTETNGPTELVYKFQSVTVGDETIEDLIVYNPTDVEMTSLVGTILNPHFRFLDSAFPGTGGTCEKVLQPKTTCIVSMRFAPRSEGAQRAVVRINYWEAGQPKTSYRVLVGTSEPRH